MRSDLAAVEGVSGIETNTKTKICKFKLANKDLDLQAMLAKLAKTNDHMRGFEIIRVHVDDELGGRIPAMGS